MVSGRRLAELAGDQLRGLGRQPVARAVALAAEEAPVVEPPAKQRPVRERVAVHEQRVHFLLGVIAPGLETTREQCQRHALRLLARGPLPEPTLVVDERPE